MAGLLDNLLNTAAQAVAAAAVPGARGWFRYSGRGAINVRLANAVQAVAYDDQKYRIIAYGAQSYELALGPFDDGSEADAVADAVLRMAYNDLTWPAAPTT